MARNRVYVDTPPERVFEVLSEPANYPHWVVGGREVRDADENFPEAGSKFHHRVLLRGPLGVPDHTEVIAADPPHRLVLHAKARPLGTARVELGLAPEGAGTVVTMVEGPGDSLTRLLFLIPLADLALRGRNTESLARLKRLSERGAADLRLGRRSRDRELEGARVLITGASSGIGLATARLLGSRGSRLALLARQGDALEHAVAELRGDGVDASAYAADVADAEALRAAIDEAADRLGGLDVVVANAGAASFGRFTETSDDDFRRTVDVVLGGTVSTVRAALPHLERSGGSLVAVVSLAAKMPLPTMSAYSAAKQGTRGFLRALQAELADEGSPVTISMVHPGPVDTPFWGRATSATGLLPPKPVGAYASEDVAEAIIDCIHHPRDEVTVGGLSIVGAAISGIRPLANRVLPLLSRFAQSGGDHRTDGGGALWHPSRRATADGALAARRSIVVAARTLATRLRSAV